MPASATVVWRKVSPAVRVDPLLWGPLDGFVPLTRDLTVPRRWPGGVQVASGRASTGPDVGASEHAEWGVPGGWHSGSECTCLEHRIAMATTCTEGENRRNTRTRGSKVAGHRRTERLVVMRIRIVPITHAAAENSRDLMLARRTAVNLGTPARWSVPMSARRKAAKGRTVAGRLLMKERQRPVSGV
jgi:hypothetical protein